MPPRDSPQWPLAVLLTMSAGTCVSVTTELLPMGLLPAMSRDLRVTESTLGLLVTAYAIMVAVFAAPLAMATARVPRRALLCGALAGYALSNVVMSLAPSYPVAAGARFLGGLTHGLFWGMIGGYVGRIVAADRVGRGLTIVSAGGVASVLVGLPAGTALGTALGWRAAFLVIAGISLAIAVTGWRIFPDLPGQAADRRVRMLTVARLPGLAGIVTTTAVVMLGHFSFYTYVAPFLLHVGVPERGVGLALFAYGVMGGLGLIVAGVFVDRRLRAAMIVSAAVLVLSFGALVVVGASTALAVAGTALTGAVLGCLPIFLQAAALRVAPAAAESASALNASAFNIGIGGGALLGGLAVDRWGVGALPAVAAALTGAGLVALILARRVGLVPA